MSWYYAENNERRGPIEDAAFEGLVHSGSIRPETLVWREGMANWAPYSEAAYMPEAAAAIPPSGAEAAPMTSPGGVEMGRCTESGRLLPRSELVEIDGKLVSAEYKNVVLQRIREGVGASGSSEDPELLAQRIEERGWEIRAGDCIGTAWRLMKSRFWMSVGAVLVVYLCIIASSMIPFGSLVVQGPLFGGLYWMFLRLMRGGDATFSDAFQGFSRGWGHLVGVSVSSTILMLVCVLPGIGFIIGGTAMAGQNASTAMTLMWIGGVLVFLGFLLACYFVVSWTFAIPLVIDKRLEFWPAMKLSRRVIGMHWWQVFGLLFLTGLMMMGLMIGALIVIALVVAGLSAISQDKTAAIAVAVLMAFGLGAGFFMIVPVFFATMAVAYERIFGDRTAA